MRRVDAESERTVMGKWSWFYGALYLVVLVEHVVLAFTREGFDQGFSFGVSAMMIIGLLGVVRDMRDAAQEELDEQEDEGCECPHVDACPERDAK